jgi:hypothetical protein
MECEFLLACHSGALMGIPGFSGRVEVSGSMAKIAEHLKVKGIISEAVASVPKMWATDRIERHTWSSKFGLSLPLECSLTDEIDYSQPNSKAGIRSFYMFNEGSIVVRGISSMMGVHDGVSIGEAVAEIRNARQAFDYCAGDLLRKIYSQMAEFMGLPEASSANGGVELNEITSRFDLIDFDGSGRNVDGGGIAFESARQDPVVAKELAGFLRLTRSGVWERYSPKFVQDFLEQDFGHREDDLWIVVGRRLFRRHPENRKDVKDYFSDLVLACTAMIARETTVEALSEAIRVDAAKIAEIDPTRNDGGNEIGSQEVSRVASMMPTLMGPSRFADHFEHDFFRRLVDEVSGALRLDQLEKEVAQQANAYFSTIDSIVEMSLATQSVSLDQTVTRLTRLAFWLSFIILSLTIAQVVISSVK